MERGTSLLHFKETGISRIVDCEVLLATAGPLDIGDGKGGTFAMRLALELSAPHDKITNSEGAEGEAAAFAIQQPGTPGLMVCSSYTVSEG